MVEQLDLQPGQRVLELAAGPGDTGFLAAELVRPGGSLISSDASEAMLGVARARARDLGVTNVEFKQLELEWIDLADRQRRRRPLSLGADVRGRPGSGRSRRHAACFGREAGSRSPCGTSRSATRGRRFRPGLWSSSAHAEPPDPDAPGMFALADPDRLQELLETAGFVDAVVEAVELNWHQAGLGAHLEEMLDLSRPLADVRERLSPEEWSEVADRVADLAKPFTAADGSLRFPASSLVASASG